MAMKGEAVIRRAYTAFGERDLETLIDLSDESIEVSTVTGLLAGRTEPYRGHEGLAEYMSDLTATWKRLELQPQHFHAVGEGRVLVFGRVRAWHGHGFLDSSNAWLWTLRDDRVLEVRVYADPGRRAARLRRRGLSPSGAAKASAAARSRRRSSRARWSVARSESSAKSAPSTVSPTAGAQRLPEGALAGHPEQQPLELDHPAERRVGEQAVVGLQPAELLRGPPGGVLDRARLHPEAVHHPLERLAVGGDLVGDLRQLGAVLGPGVRAGRPAGELEAPGGGRVVVLEVGAQHRGASSMRVPGTAGCRPLKPGAARCR